VIASHTETALTGFLPAVLPEIVLGVAGCVLFLGGTWRTSRNLWSLVTLVALAGAGLLAVVSLIHDRQVTSILQHIEAEVGEKNEQEVLERRQQVVAFQPPTIEALQQQIEVLARLDADLPEGERESAAKETVSLEQGLRATMYASPVLLTRLALLVKVIAFFGAIVLVLFSWNEVSSEHAPEYLGCLLFLTAGVGLIGAANDLITLFLALELVSIPTYILLYLVRLDASAQEAAMKYFLLSVFSSGLLLFGFSYLYGLTGTTNLTALNEALRLGGEGGVRGLPAVAVVALIMVVAGLGFRITAVPFHFYAPDVYQGTSTGAAALLAFIPKVAGFIALFRTFGLASPTLSGDQGPLLTQHLPRLLWILALVTMTLGNVLALLQDNLKRLLAYSSVAHAGYMLIGLAVAPHVHGQTGSSVDGAEALLIYLVAYGAMTIGAFAVLHYLQSTAEEGWPVENVEHFSGLARSHPGTALLMALFLLSLIGIPLTAGFLGKFYVILGALSVPRTDSLSGTASTWQLAYWFKGLAVLAMINAAIGAWYYLRIITVMFLREPIRTFSQARPWPVLGAIWTCALLTLGLGVYPTPLVRLVQSAVPDRVSPPANVVARIGGKR
jgi:NADH-quinone oxidoreductase subunit N